ncbi:MAG: hypothetical protein K8L99_07435 [Anaerolineae bacterium]|nr:hypothetical protein [Anaerolineae bacterium]
MDGEKPLDKSENEVKSGNITTGDIKGTGIAVGHGAKAIVQQYASSGTELADSFRPIYEKIENREDDANVAKDEIAETVKKIEDETGSGEPNIKKIERWLGFLANMAPDIFDVTVATLTNPIVGVGEIIRKVAVKARQENGTN